MPLLLAESLSANIPATLRDGTFCTSRKRGFVWGIALRENGVSCLGNTTPKRLHFRRSIKKERLFHLSAPLIKGSATHEKNRRSYLLHTCKEYGNIPDLGKASVYWTIQLYKNAIPQVKFKDARLFCYNLYMRIKSERQKSARYCLCL